MARPWVLQFYLATSELAPGLDALPEDAMATFPAAMRHLYRDKEYRMAFDPARGLWAVYTRAGSRQPDGD